MRTVIIDSLTGYIASMGEEASLMLQLRNLLTYLGENGDHRTSRSSTV